MAEVVACQFDGRELVFDTDDVAYAEMPRDVVTTPGPGGWDHHEFGQHAHLNITFKPGKQARWRPTSG